MFSLIRFSNGDHDVFQTSKLMNINKNKCTVKWKKSGRFEATIISRNDSSEVLKELMKRLISGEPQAEHKVSCAERTKMGKTANDQLNNIVLEQNSVDTFNTVQKVYDEPVSKVGLPNDPKKVFLDNETINVHRNQTMQVIPVEISSTVVQGPHTANVNRVILQNNSKEIFLNKATIDVQRNQNKEVIPVGMSCMCRPEMTKAISNQLNNIVLEDNFCVTATALQEMYTEPDDKADIGTPGVHCNRNKKATLIEETFMQKPDTAKTINTEINNPMPEDNFCKTSTTVQELYTEPASETDLRNASNDDILETIVSYINHNQNEQVFPTKRAQNRSPLIQLPVSESLSSPSPIQQLFDKNSFSTSFLDSYEASLSDFINENNSDIQLSDKISNKCIKTADSIVLDDYQANFLSSDSFSAQFDENVDLKVLNEDTFLNSQSLTSNLSELENREEESVIQKKCSIADDKEVSNEDYLPSDKDGDEYSSDEYTEDTSTIKDALTSNHSCPDKSYISTNSSINLSSSINVPGHSACDDIHLRVDAADGSKGKGKKYFCYYCHKLQSKIARHLERAHSDEELVKKFTLLSKKSQDRQDAISDLRNKGNFLYNSKPEFNEGIIIPVRRPQAKKNRTGMNFVPCGKCKGFYSRNNIRHHYAICANKEGNSKIVLIHGRRMIGRIHEDACRRLRQTIFPVMREDNVVRVIRYDCLIILYGNQMCRKYKLQHQEDMIRAHLRLTGRFLLALKEIKPEIVDFKSLYHPKFYNSVIAAVNEVAGFDEKKDIYKTPTNASTIGTILKKISKILESECIKVSDDEAKKNVKDFMTLFDTNFGCSVNKTVTETQARMKRQKKVILPKERDIQDLNLFLMKKRDSALESLQKAFSYSEWLLLAQVVLIYIQVFNRRRSGEIERVLINDYKNYQRIDETDEIYKSLPQSSQEIAQKYVRFTIRGKLNRSVPVLLDLKTFECIETILRLRANAKVPSKNPYVFGVPNITGAKGYKYLRACILIRKFAKECGAANSENLRGTALRKQLATQCVAMNLTDNQIGHVANFMGHHETIHKQIYRQPTVTVDIVDISQVLEKTQGINDNGNKRYGKEYTSDNNDEIISMLNETFERSESSSNASDGCNDTLAMSNLKISKLGAEKTKKAKSKKMTKSSENCLIQDSSYEDLDHNADIELQNSRKRKRTYKGNKKRRSSSPHGKVTRRRWSHQEREHGFRLFSNYIEAQTLPSLKDIQTKQKKYRCLEGRQPAVIKAWISNQIKSNKVRVQ